MDAGSFFFLGFCCAHNLFDSLSQTQVCTSTQYLVKQVKADAHFSQSYRFPPYLDVQSTLPWTGCTVGPLVIRLPDVFLRAE